MACSQILTSISNDCAKSMGGLKVVYAANYDDVVSIGVEDGKITSITMKTIGSGTTTAKFKKFEFRRNTASMTSTLNVDAANGNSINTDVSLSFLKQETAKRLAISALALGELVLLVVDANGLTWYLGREMPVSASAGGAESGTAFTDGNKYTITLQDVSSDFPYEVKTAPETTEDTDYVDISEIVDNS